MTPSTFSPTGPTPGRVLLLGAFLSKSRATRAVGEDLAERLRARGWQVTTASHYAQPVPRLADSLATIFRSRGLYDLAHIDVYSGRSFRVAEACAALLRRLGKPYLVTLHGGGLPELARREPRRVGALLKGARHVTSPSAFLKRELGFVATDIEVVPNPIDLSRYSYRERTIGQRTVSESTVSESTASESLTSETADLGELVCKPATPEPRLLWLRAFADIYRPADAIRTIKYLHQNGIRARLELVGPDKGGKALDEVRRELSGVEDFVTLNSEGVAKEDVPTVFDRNDIFLNTTSVDNTPITVLEAMASGLPVVSTDAGGLSDLLTNEEDALLVPVGKASALAGAVLRLTSEPELGLRLARTARARVEAWDWNQVICRWERLLHSHPSDRRAA